MNGSKVLWQRNGIREDAMRAVALLLLGVANGQIEDLVLLPNLVKMANRGGGPPDAPTTMWSPSIVVTNNNTTLATAQAQWKKDGQFIRGAAITARSADGGRSFEANQSSRPGGAQMLYSRQTNTIHAFGLQVPNASADDALTWSKSTDDGQTWTAPIVAMDGPGWGAGGGAGCRRRHLVP